MSVAVQESITLMNGFNEKEMTFAINILKQIPERRLDENSYVCEYGYVHGAFKDDDIEAFEECEEIIRKIESGERKPRYSNVSELMADLLSEDEDEI